MRASNAALAEGQTGAVAVYLEAQATDNMLGFGLRFDPALASDVGTVIGGDATRATPLANPSQAGTILQSKMVSERAFDSAWIK